MAPRRKINQELLALQARRQLNPWPTAYPKFFAACWDLADGEHPMLPAAGALFSFQKFSEAEARRFNELSTPLVPCVDGHNTVIDGGYAEAAGLELPTPISPIFVKDLADRVIYIGYGPEEKRAEQWARNRSITFPAGCQAVSAQEKGANFIGSVFFTRFRTLDMAFDYTAMPSGRADLGYAAHYNRANLYPYKIRPDTFYQDGWRLPQTSLLFAKQDVVEEEAEKAAAELVRRWQERPPTQDYETFYETQSGEIWFEELFQAGCTVIPTVEACNGFNMVSADFELENFWPGRAVEGLHEIVRQEPNEAPKGTILSVEAPGYLLHHKIHKARVVVSDGSGYATPHGADPEAKIPNLTLPHQRTAATWGATWLPTHPSHFEQPAMWGWEKESGRFLQLSGPLWDPLHYYYTSTPHILRAFRTPMLENEFLATVPEEMKTRFYPVKMPDGFDTFSQQTREQRQQEGVRPLSAVDRLRDGQTYCGVGYHPLPLSFEYELSSWWFPNLAPHNRDLKPVPAELEARLMPVIQSKVGSEVFMSSLRVEREASWFYDEDQLPVSTGDVQQDYPHLFRGNAEVSAAEIMAETSVFLAHIPDRVLNRMPQETLGQAELREEWEGKAPGFFDAFYEFLEQAKSWRQKRHNFFRRQPGWYAFGVWKSLTPEALETLADEEGNGSRQEGERAILRSSVASSA